MNLPRSRHGSICSALIGFLLLPALVLAFTPSGTAAHGGYPLSLGTAVERDLGPVFRLVLVYLREGQGMTVEALFYDNETALGEAYRGRKVDLLVHAPPKEWAAAHCAASDGGGDITKVRESYFAGIFPGSWSAPFAGAGSGVVCGLSIAAHPRITGDLRFSLLKNNLARLLASIDARDISELLREGGTEPRAQVAAARRLLKREGLI